jgi:hypothetical protein
LVACWGAAQAASIEARAAAETAEDPKRSGLIMSLSLPFGLTGHDIEFGHATEQLIERVGHELLGRAAVDCAGKPELEMAIRIEPQGERGLGLASGRGARARQPPRRWRAYRSGYGDWSRCGSNDWSWRGRFFDIGLAKFGGFVRLALNGVFDIVRRKTVGNFRLLIVHRRLNRRQAGRVHARVLDDVVAERIMFRIASDERRLGRLETHVVPAEVLKACAGLAEALRPHRRARGALAGEKSGGE